ncbi:MAG: hypothetical protein ABSG15_14100 [FCB group bacterium]|jgi:hypothetical protein
MKSEINTEITSRRNIVKIFGASGVGLFILGFSPIKKIIQKFEPVSNAKIDIKIHPDAVKRNDEVNLNG